MDKSKIIDEMLMEWAMRSPDGLVGGHDTPENMAVLNEILNERGEYNQLDAFTADKNNIDKLDTSQPTTLQKSISKFSSKNLIDDKNFEIEVADKIVDAAKEAFGKNIVEFENIYDSMTAKKAVEFINMQSKNPAFSKFIDLIDAASIRRLVKTQVGRGEFILSMLIKDCKRTGQKSGDLELSDGTVIDVKEVDKDGKFRVSLKAFGSGNFSKLRFPHAINQLFAYCRQNPDAVEILKNMIDEAGIKDEGRSKYKKYTLKLLDELDWDSVTSTAVRGLLDITIHIQKMKPDEVEKAGLGNKVEFDLGDEEVLMSIDKIEPEDKNKILNPTKKSEPVTVNVSPITDRSNQVIVPQLKKLEIFAKPTSENMAFSTVTIANEMFGNMKHYSGGIIFYDKGVGYTYEPDLVNMEKPFLFYLYAQATVTFKRIE